MMKIISTAFMLSIFATFPGGSLNASDPLETIQLPPAETTGGIPLMQALSNRMSTKAFDSQEILLSQMSNLLWAAFGINRPDSGKRTAASAVNCQDIDIYVVLKKAAYVYEAKRHRLIPVVDRDIRALAATQQYAQEAPINLVFVSDFSKMANGVDDERPIYAAFHAGSISQNVYLYCASAGLGAVVRASFDRAGLKDVLHLSENQFIVMTQSVGYAAGR
jgi:SagB-type dehydrogenase family enzyme